jgi:hypothetical protein
MIIDCHTHVWEYPDHISEELMKETVLAYPGRGLHVNPDEHYEAMRPVDHAIVFGMAARATGFCVPNQYVARYVSRDPSKLIGFAAVDPNDEDCIDQLKSAVNLLGLRGLKLGPIYQHVHPHDSKIYRLYEAAEQLKIPVIIHQGATYPRRAPLEFAHPIDMERVALDFPHLKIVIAHLGHPWEHETIVLIRKQPNVYSDVSALFYRPWQFYNSMRMAEEYGVMHKLLFGSDYPFTSPAQTLEKLKQINQLPRAANLPLISERAVEELIHRDTLSLLGIPRPVVNKPGSSS